ncbi:MAG: DrmE family protein [Nanoarchaeota archaeon]
MKSEDLHSTIRKNSFSNLCDLQDLNMLRYENKPLKFQRVDQILFLLANKALKDNKSVAFVYPVAKQEVLLPLCVDLIYALDLEGKILLYTNLMRYRYLYPKLATTNMSFHDVVSLGIVKHDGNLKAVKKANGYRLSDMDVKIILTNDAQNMPNEENAKAIRGIVIDMDSTDSLDEIIQIIEYAHNNRINTLIFFGTNMDSPFLPELVKRNIKIWAWNEEMLREEILKDKKKLEDEPQSFHNPFSHSIVHVKNLIEGVNRHIEKVGKNTQFAKQIDVCRDYAAELAHYGKSQKMEQVMTLSRWMKGAIYYAERILCSWDLAETECANTFLGMPFSRRFERMNKFVDKMSEDEPVIASSVSKALTLLEALGNEAEKLDTLPKTEKVLEKVKNAVDSHKTVLVVTYSQPFKRATQKYLTSMLNKEISYCGVDVVSIDDPVPGESYDYCIIFGQTPYTKMHVLKTTCAKNVIILCYPSEEKILSMQINRELKGTNKIANKELRKSTLNHLFPKLSKEHVEMLSGSDSGTPSIKSNFNEDEKDSLFARMFEEEKELEEDEMYGVDDDTDDEEREENQIYLPSTEFIFKDGHKLYVKIDKPVPVLRADKLEYREANKVKTGDVIVLIDMDARKKLADTIFKQANSHPKFAYMKALLDAWQRVLKDGMKKNNYNCRNVLELMKNKGSKISTPAAVYFWKMGWVIGPTDKKDILRIGEIFNEPTLIQNYQEIHAAARRVRGIHIKIVKTLNRLILEKQSKNQTLSDDVVDEEFNLHAEDFLKAVSLHTVKASRKIKEIPVYKLNKLR